VAWFDILKRLIVSSGESDSRKLVEIFQSRFNYQFKDKSLLIEALTHRSYIRAVNSEAISNERLEFLGDSVLGVLIATHLFQTYPDYDEGSLTKIKAMLVNETTLSMIGRGSKLNQLIFLSEEEEKSGGRERNSIVSDVMEAIIGAIYLDGGLAAAKKFIHRTIMPHMDDILADDNQRNYKGELLEYMQGRSRGTPHYEVLSEKGPDHAKIFKIGVYTVGELTGIGIGSSKKEAEQRAAAASLENLSSDDNENK
jgi:ribonuclease-3